MGQKANSKAFNIAWTFFHQKKEFEQNKKEFESLKATFEEAMSEHFSDCGDNSTSFESDGLVDGELIVKKVEKASIEWDANKLEKRVEKSVAKQIIKKQYRVVDMQGLIQYLKECGVDPTIFKRHIAVDKTVDEKAIDRLGDTGQLTVQQISGCYLVKGQKPYFTISVKSNDNGE